MKSRSSTYWPSSLLELEKTASSRNRVRTSSAKSKRDRRWLFWPFGDDETPSDATNAWDAKTEWTPATAAQPVSATTSWGNGVTPTDLPSWAKTSTSPEPLSSGS